MKSDQIFYHICVSLSSTFTSWFDKGVLNSHLPLPINVCPFPTQYGDRFDVHLAVKVAAIKHLLFVIRCFLPDFYSSEEELVAAQRPDMSNNHPVKFFLCFCLK